MFEIRKSDTVEISKEICIILFIVKYLIFNAKIGEIFFIFGRNLYLLTLKRRIYEKSNVYVHQSIDCFECLFV